MAFFDSGCLMATSCHLTEITFCGSLSSQMVHVFLRRQVIAIMPKCVMQWIQICWMRCLFLWD